MKDRLFAELAASVREGAATLRGEKKPARTFAIVSSNRNDIPAAPVQALREKREHE